jgi:hypothetical protein
MYLIILMNKIKCSQILSFPLFFFYLLLLSVYILQLEPTNFIWKVFD